MTMEDPQAALDVAVTVAIDRAERLPADSSEARAAYAEVSSIEEALAALHPAMSVEGAVARVERPLGPKATPQTKSVFKPDAVRVLFALPNGFYAYALYDASGNRIDRVLPGIEKLYAGVEGTALEPSSRAGSN